MKKYKVIALENLEGKSNSWTKGVSYEVTETDTNLQLTSNEGQFTYEIMLKDVVLINFKIA